MLNNNRVKLQVCVQIQLRNINFYDHIDHHINDDGLYWRRQLFFYSSVTIIRAAASASVICLSNCVILTWDTDAEYSHAAGLIVHAGDDDTAAPGDAAVEGVIM